MSDPMLWSYTGIRRVHLKDVEFAQTSLCGDFSFGRQRAYTGTRKVEHGFVEHRVALTELDHDLLCQRCERGARARGWIFIEGGKDANTTAD